MRERPEPARVLLVDDDPAQLRTLAALLRDELPSFDIVTATSGADALRILRTERVDVLVTDVAMPAMTGLEAVAQLHHEGGRVRVIVISGLVGPVASAEVDAWLEKPVDVAAMARTIRGLINSRG